MRVSESQVVTDSFREPGLDWASESQVLTESVREPGLYWELPRARSWLRASESQVLTESFREPGLDWELPRSRSWLRASESQVLTESFREPSLHWERPRARSWLRASENQVLTESFREPGLDWELARARSWLRASEVLLGSPQVASGTEIYMGREGRGREDGVLVRISDVSCSCLASQTGYFTEGFLDFPHLHQENIGVGPQVTSWTICFTSFPIRHSLNSRPTLRRYVNWVMDCIAKLWTASLSYGLHR
jgi:hypothetical protein